jgi:protein O-GlcNAc transferase
VISYLILQFDEAIQSLLLSIPSSILVLLGPSKKQPWKLTLLERWTRVFGESITKNRIVWLGSLSAEEYMSLLILGDLMLDPYPFGGGVTMLESLAVATPIITLPARQTVPALAEGMLRKMAQESPELQSLAVSSISRLVYIAMQLLANPIKFRALILHSIHLVFNDQMVFHSWEKFFETSLKQLSL